MWPLYRNVADSCLLFLYAATLPITLLIMISLWSMLESFIQTILSNTSNDSFVSFSPFLTSYTIVLVY